MATILIVEDDDDIRGQLERDVTGDGHRVTGVAGGTAALEAVSRSRPDLIVLDLRLPDVNGIEVCRRIRQEGMCMPILILTSERDIVTRVLGFECGADDYVTKPFETLELLARIRRHSSRFLAASPERESRAAAESGLRIDLDNRRVWRDGDEIELTTKEFEILALLVQNADQPVSRETLLKEACQYRPDVTTRTIDTHVSNLRRKLERDPANPERIVAVHGRGYKYVTKKR